MKIKFFEKLLISVIFTLSGMGLYIVYAVSSQDVQAKSVGTHKRVARNLAAKAEPANTAISLPLSALRCVPQPTSAVVTNVKDLGAMGDGKTDDTKAIQKAVNGATGSGGTVLIPAGTYLINAEEAIRLYGNFTLKMAEGAVLKAIPNDKDSFNVILIKDAENINIIGGIIEGERDTHKGTTGEWGMGIHITHSKNIMVENVIAKNHWGDGFYVSNHSENLKFCGVIADNNRRHGMAVVSARGLLVRFSTFQRNNGYVGGGLDIEPNEDNSVEDYEISNSSFLFNQACGITTSVPGANAGKAFVRNGVINNNIVMNNGKAGSYTAGILVSRQNGIKITNNVVSNNLQNGIFVVDKSKGNVIVGNIIENNGNRTDKDFGAGIYLEESSDNVIENNHVSGSARFDIYDENSKNHLKKNSAIKVHRGQSPY
jgi:parallel beta-helix repeat protein